MTVMAGAATRAGRGPLTRDDLDLMPDDGCRYELIDGVLVVSPSPPHRHQRAVGRLAILLEDACPDDLEVLFAPFDVALADDTVMIPDLIVARRSELTPREQHLHRADARGGGAVAEHEARRSDAQAVAAGRRGLPVVLVVEPAVPSLTALELRGGSYAEVSTSTGDEDFAAVASYAVTIRPADLVREHRRR